jgi:hypothetical protein
MRVVVWLGEEENDSDRAMRILSCLGDQVDVDFQTEEILPSSNRINAR